MVFPATVAPSPTRDSGCDPTSGDTTASLPRSARGRSWFAKLLWRSVVACCPSPRWWGRIIRPGREETAKPRSPSVRTAGGSSRGVVTGTSASGTGLLALFSTPWLDIDSTSMLWPWHPTGGRLLQALTTVQPGFGTSSGGRHGGFFLCRGLRKEYTGGASKPSPSPPMGGRWPPATVAASCGSGMSSPGSYGSHGSPTRSV